MFVKHLSFWFVHPKQSFQLSLKSTRKTQRIFAKLDCGVGTEGHLPKWDGSIMSATVSTMFLIVQWGVGSFSDLHSSQTFQMDPSTTLCSSWKKHIKLLLWDIVENGTNIWCSELNCVLIPLTCILNCLQE